MSRPPCRPAEPTFRDPDRASERLHVALSRATDPLVVVGDPDVIRAAGDPEVARRLGITGTDA